MAIGASKHLHCLQIHSRSDFHFFSSSNSSKVDEDSSMDGIRLIKFILTLCLFETFATLVTAGDLSSDIRLSETRSNAQVHSRKRRYVVFPEGSTLTVATSLQVAACVSPTALSGTGAIFTSGLAWALSYDLPNETIHTKDNKYEFPIMIRRHKRDLFVKMEKLMDSAGIEGKSCVLKTICETTQRIVPRQGVLEEILRLLFTYPPEKESKLELKGSRQYVKAHRTGESGRNCDDFFPCPISLLDIGLGFGKYSQTYI